jgi:hypothetical protein
MSNFGEDKNMKTKITHMTSSILKSIVVLACCSAASVISLGAAESKEDAAAASPSQQKEFASPKEAADALVKVAESLDVAAAKELLGPQAEDLVASEDPVMDKKHAEEFATKAKQKMSIDTDKKDSSRAIILVGNDDFPMPIPLVKRKGKWSFDTKVGREEILNRRIGENELNAITVCRGYVEAQHEYAADKHDDAKVNQYAQVLLSSPGKHDGLTWQNPDGTWGGPVGQEVAKALQEGYSVERGKPFHGYFFKVLKGQGKDAPMGELDFVVGGAMIGGFAMAAAPAQYRVTGVMTFIVGPDGVVYQKDLGPDTAKTFETMDRYNPDKSWQETEDDAEDEPAEVAANQPAN